MKNNNQALQNWTPQEIKALARATAKLRMQQPAKPNKGNESPNLRGCYYNTNAGVYIVNSYIDGHRIYAGRLIEWDEAAALAMQYDAEQKYNKIKSK